MDAESDLTIALIPLSPRHIVLLDRPSFPIRRDKMQSEAEE